MSPLLIRVGPGANIYIRGLLSCTDPRLLRCTLYFRLGSKAAVQGFPARGRYIRSTPVSRPSGPALRGLWRAIRSGLTRTHGPPPRRRKGLSHIWRGDETGKLNPSALTLSVRAPSYIRRGRPRCTSRALPLESRPSAVSRPRGVARAVESCYSPHQGVRKSRHVNHHKFVPAEEE